MLPSDLQLITKLDFQISSLKACSKSANLQSSRKYSGAATAKKFLIDWHGIFSCFKITLQP